MVVVAMIALSGGQALAGWGWEDCPPASGKGVDNMSATAYEQVQEVQAPRVADSHAKGDNPGKKPAPVFRTGE